MLPEGPKQPSKEFKKPSFKKTQQKKVTKKEKVNYGAYIYKVLKQVHPDTEISSQAMSIMSSFINEIFDKIATESARVSAQNGTSIISSREVQSSVRALLTGELAKHAISEGARVVARSDSKFPVKNFENALFLK